MRIAFLVVGFPAISETFILNQIKGLIDRGYTVDVFAQFQPKVAKAHPVVNDYKLLEHTYYLNAFPKNVLLRFLKGVIEIILKLPFYPAPVLRSLNIFQHGRQAASLRLFYMLKPFLGKEYDILHCHFGSSGNIAASLKSMGVKGKILTTFHGADVNMAPQQEGPDLYNKLFEKGDHFTANTNFTKKQAMNLGADANKFDILPVGIFMDKFTFKPRTVNAGEAIRLLSVGRLVEKKGHAFAMNVIARLIKEGRLIKYTIAGDGPLKEDLIEQAKVLGIQADVEFLGAVNENEIIALYNNAHIFVLPCVTAQNGDREGQCMVLQEAQAAGLPVVSTVHNGIPDGVFDGHSGFLVPEKDEDALYEKLKWLLENPKKWEEMGREGRAFVQDKYDIERLNDQLVDVYKKILIEGENT